jgi:hypothetical protein
MIKQSDIHNLRKDIVAVGIKGELCIDYADDELLTYDSVLTLTNIKGISICSDGEEIAARLKILGLKMLSISAEGIKVGITADTYVMI